MYKKVYFVCDDRGVVNGLVNEQIKFASEYCHIFISVRNEYECEYVCMLVKTNI